MTPFFSQKTIVLWQPQVIQNTATPATLVIDTLGFDTLSVKLFLGATDIALTALKLQESDVKASSTTLTGGTDVPGSVFGTDVKDDGTVSVLPSATDDNSIYEFLVNLAGSRKRYILLVYTIGTGVAGAYTCAIAELGRAKDGPRTAADVGDAQRLIVA